MWIEKDEVPARVSKARYVGETVSVTPPCVSDTVMVIPPPEIVRIALRKLTVPLADTVMVKVASPVPLAGETETHAASSLRLQLTLAWSAMVLLSVAEPNARLDGDAVKITPACVTVTCPEEPPADTVIIPVRELVDVLAVTVTVTTALPDPLVGDTVSHAALSVMLQLTGDVMEYF